MYERHRTILGGLHIALGIIPVFVALIAYSLLLFAGVMSGDPTARMITGRVGSLVAFLLLLIGLPGFLSGIGLLAGAGWAKVLAVIVGALNLVNFPIGTAIGAYTIWVIASDKEDEKTKPPAVISS
ncbi:MAG: hypothetical protein JW958_13695 [Candidatus Eisenbacteria bacterium]|nr:hypothetical protein [Candidatus Eisenbacteria bacterium]